MSKYVAKPKDKLGSRKGTTASKVNSVMSGKWMTVEEITKRTKLSRYKVARRLYRGREIGLYDYEKIIRFKIKRKHDHKNNKS